ncbi:hypothetical protein [Caballeronia glebae]|uniref:hypothetical protein n=1 Tax=Caballeronia glebae TaxID=1777143 RepID=UPI0038BB7467
MKIDRERQTKTLDVREPTRRMQLMVFGGARFEIGTHREHRLPPEKSSLKDP